MKFDYPEGATPLSPDEIDGLIPSYITMHSELNALEQINITSAQLWLFRRKMPLETMLTESFLNALHKKMYAEVWTWSGKYRQSDKNIGVDWIKIPIFLRQLLDDIKFQILHNTYSSYEIAIRFHHRLVWIHPYVNGNGRHARIMTDFLLKKLSDEKLSWGGNSLESYSKATDIRKKYIEALRKADRGDYSSLLVFCKSDN